MREIHDGLIYNTATATKLGEASSHLYRSDFGWWSEELYRTPRGRYFLSGEGNAASSWSKPHADGRGPGSGIRPLTEDQAKAWAERYLSTEEYEAVWTPEEA